MGSSEVNSYEKFSSTLDYTSWLKDLVLFVGRFSYSSDPENRARPTVTNIRLTASSELNINLSTANVNMLLEAYASWNRMNQLEEKSKKQFSLVSFLCKVKHFTTCVFQWLDFESTCLFILMSDFVY